MIPSIKYTVNDSYTIDLVETGRGLTGRVMQIVLSVLEKIPLIGSCIRHFLASKGMGEVKRCNVNYIKLQIPGIEKKEISFFVQRKWIPLKDLVQTVTHQAEIKRCHQLYQLLKGYHLAPDTHWLGELYPVLARDLKQLNPAEGRWKSAVYERHKQQLHEMAEIDFVMGDRKAGFPVIRGMTNDAVGDALADHLNDGEDLLFDKCRLIMKGLGSFQSLCLKMEKDLGVANIGHALRIDASAQNPFHEDQLINFYLHFLHQNDALQFSNWAAATLRQDEIVSFALLDRAAQLTRLMPEIQKTYQLPIEFVLHDLQEGTPIAAGLKKLGQRRQLSDHLSYQGQWLRNFHVSVEKRRELADYFACDIVNQAADVKEFSDIFNMCLWKWYQQNYAYPAKVVALGVKARFDELITLCGSRQGALDSFKKDEPALHRHCLREYAFHVAKEEIILLGSSLKSELANWIHSFVDNDARYVEKLLPQEKVDHVAALVLQEVRSQLQVVCAQNTDLPIFLIFLPNLLRAYIPEEEVGDLKELDDCTQELMSALKKSPLMKSDRQQLGRGGVDKCVSSWQTLLTYYGRIDTSLEQIDKMLMQMDEKTFSINKLGEKLAVNRGLFDTVFVGPLHEFIVSTLLQGLLGSFAKMKSGNEGHIVGSVFDSIRRHHTLFSTGAKIIARIPQLAGWIDKHMQYLLDLEISSGRWLPNQRLFLKQQTPLIKKMIKKMISYFFLRVGIDRFSKYCLSVDQAIRSGPLNDHRLALKSNNEIRAFFKDIAIDAERLKERVQHISDVWDTVKD